MKPTILIVYQDERPDLERTAANLRERLSSDRAEAISRPASQVSIPEVLAASSFVFGADEPSAPGFAEVERLLSGVNLAGRKAAFFGSNGAAVAWLKSMAADSELAVSGSDLVAAKPEPATLAAWARSIS